MYLKKKQLILFVFALTMILATKLSLWSMLRASPPVVHPSAERTLDPDVAALVAAKVARAEKHPREASAHGDLGLVYEANLLWEEARDSYAEAARLAPNDRGWRLHLAIATRQAGDFEGALAMLRTLAEKYPDDAPIQQRLGEALLEHGDFTEAEAAFRRVIALEPELPHGYAGLGDALLQQNEPAEAAEALERAVAKAPGYRAAHYLLGQAYQRLNRASEAERELSLGVDAGRAYLPDALDGRVRAYAVNLTARLQRAGEYLNAGNPGKAAELLKKAYKAHPENVDVINNLAIAHMRMNRMDEARRLLERARTLDDARFSTYLNLSSWAMQSGRPEQALAFADSALARAPTLAQAFFARGQALARLERLEEALDDLAECLRRDPRKAEAHALSGDLLFRLKRYDEAETHYREALRLDPNLFPAEVGLARTAWVQGRPGEARAALARARKLAPDHPIIARLTRQFGQSP
ncbi:tetratricopeptide repeat protein [Rhodocaloribacter sp.]